MNRLSSFDKNVTRAISVGRAEANEGADVDFRPVFAWMSEAYDFPTLDISRLMKTADLRWELRVSARSADSQRI